jgi:hypothetical protein
MELIGAGWGRTGTMSLKTALEILDMPCYHMIECLKHDDHSLLWIKAAKGEAVDYDSILSGYKATVDWPAAPFYKQLMERYPNAKVIVTTRDPAKWYKSMHDTVWTIYQVLRSAPWYVKQFPGRGPVGRLQREMLRTSIWDGDLQGIFGSDPDKAQQLFLQHIEEVKQFVPADRLLVFEVSQGWGPLCEFLGKPVPEQPFPHVNDTKSMKRIIAGIQKKQNVLTYTIPAAAAALVAAAAAAVTVVVGKWASG